MIQMIPRSQLEAHPDNPRKDLGDLSELAASMRKQGILQNLTVVPHPDKPDKYRIVIGHRRFAAAGIAEIDPLPCSIDEKMTYPEQLAVMMSENVQRNDLTVTERVGGIQMMMDLGMDTREVASNTGISETTVRRYAKLSKLAPGRMAAAERQGATLMQFSEISEIEYDDLRDEALEAAGTNKYGDVMRRVRNKRDHDKYLPLMLNLLAFAQKVDKQDYGHHSYEQTYWTDDNGYKKLQEFKPGERSQYVFTVNDSRIELYRVLPKSNLEKEAERRAAQERLREKIRNEGVLSDQFKIRWKEYFRKNAWSHMLTGLKFLIWQNTRRDYQQSVPVTGLFAELIPDCPAASTGTVDINKKLLDEQFDSKDQLLRAAVCAAFDRASSFNMRMMDTHTGEYKPNPNVIELYDFMKEYGYQASDEELAWLDGTHECFKAVNA